MSSDPKQLEKQLKQYDHIIKACWKLIVTEEVKRLENEIRGNKNKIHDLSNIIKHHRCEYTNNLNKALEPIHLSKKLKVKLKASTKALSKGEYEKSAHEREQKLKSEIKHLFSKLYIEAISDHKKKESELKKTLSEDRDSLKGWKTSLEELKDKKHKGGFFSKSASSKWDTDESSKYTIFDHLVNIHNQAQSGAEDVYRDHDISDSNITPQKADDLITQILMTIKTLKARKIRATLRKNAKTIKDLVLIAVRAIEQRNSLFDYKRTQCYQHSLAEASTDEHDTCVTEDSSRVQEDRNRHRQGPIPKLATLVPSDDSSVSEEKSAQPETIEENSESSDSECTVSYVSKIEEGEDTQALPDTPPPFLYSTNPQSPFELESSSMSSDSPPPPPAHSATNPQSRAPSTMPRPHSSSPQPAGPPPFRSASSPRVPRTMPRPGSLNGKLPLHGLAAHRRHQSVGGTSVAKQPPPLPEKKLSHNIHRRPPPPGR